jgi:uncharacterized protein (DUF2249 family)
MAELDVRGLAPCEPLERTLAALDALPPGESLIVHLSREPFPLYDWLREHGFAWQTKPGDEGFTLEIRVAVPE